VTRLAIYREAAVILAGVLGFPVAHSRSPAMMNAAFGALGMDWLYVHLPVPPGLFAETVRALPGSGYRGANVTIPHKVAARDAVDERTPAAQAIGAVNTLLFEPDGRMLGDNTDAGGLIDAIDGDLRGRRALVLGAGGAARAAVWALREVGAEVTVWNRTPERAVALARDLEVRAVEAGEPVDVLVNATSVGLRGEDPAEELPLVDAALVVDLVYGAEPTALCRWAEARGARVVDGLEILMCQGARSLERWTNRPAPLDAMRAGAGRV
jgi:shikimate dehydrogenase